MKTQTRTTVIVCTVLSVSAAFASPADDLRRVFALTEELNTNGVSGMLALAAKNEWKAPWMPDQWHVENVVKDPEVAKVADAGRDFGVDLTGRLDEISAELHRPVPAEVFYGHSVEMCRLAEWVSQPEALGNLLLTGRCLDLAGVGIIRLVANTNFPVERCEALLETLDKLSVQIAPRRRARILDAEADAKLFARCKTTEDLQQVWEAGVRRNLRSGLLRLKGMGSKIPDSVFLGYALVSDSLLEQRKSFFSIFESPDPLTSHNYREKENPYEKAVVGVESRSPAKAHHLLEFRKEVGYFPKPWVRSEEEKERLEKEITEAAKWGRKIVPMEQDSSFDPLKTAFQKAWYQKVRDTKRCNDYVWAYDAYKEVLEERDK
jgi:hypothetical protein